MKKISQKDNISVAGPCYDDYCNPRKTKKTNKASEKVQLTFIYQCLKVLYIIYSHLLVLSMIKMSCRYYLRTWFGCHLRRPFQMRVRVTHSRGAYGTTLAPSIYCITKTLPPIGFKTLLHIFTNFVTTLSSLY